MFRITYRPHRLNPDGFEETTSTPDGPAKIAIIIKNNLHEGVTSLDTAQWLLRSERAHQFLCGVEADLFDDTSGLHDEDWQFFQETLLRLGVRSVLLVSPVPNQDNSPVYSGLLEIDLSMIVPRQT